MYKKCANYNICRGTSPDWWHKEICVGCDLYFGSWKKGKCILTRKNSECPICLEEKECVEQPKCEHYICITCFRKIYLGEIDEDEVEQKIGKEPEHPYEEILNENNLDYDDLLKDSRFDIDKSLIEQWEIESDVYFRSKEMLSEQYCTCTCPLCRVVHE